MRRLILVSIISMCMSVGANASDWTPLFNGKDLSNWRQLGGTAQFTVKDGIIIGESKMGTTNSFLATQATFSDFIFEAEIKIQKGLNSGIQFRSQSLSNYYDGRVFGYQAEIDTSIRKWSGGIYEEAKRGWLYNLSRNETCQNAFHNEQWNHYRIEAIDNRIRTWVNEVPCTDLLDNEAGNRNGFIAIQVHSIKNKTLAGKQVKMRNPRVMTKQLRQNQWYIPTDTQQINYQINVLTSKEKQQGWRLLWDGKTTQGWKGVNIDTFPSTGWGINNGELIVYSSGGEYRDGGDIISKEEFSNFELEVDFKITEAANSGIKYFVDPNYLKSNGSAIGLEFQILDDAKHPDAKKGHLGNRTIGSLYDLIPAGNLSDPTSDTKRVKQLGTWNRARIVVKDGHVEHWLNNVKVVAYPRGGQLFEALVKKSKYAKWTNFGEWEKGPILFQDHGDQVHFRSIKVRTFD